MWRLRPECIKKSQYQFFSLHVQVEVIWNSRLPRNPPFISASCIVYDVRPVPPDPVKNVRITFQQIIPQTATDQQGGRISQFVITLRYTWRRPDFQGEGIAGYQAWLSRDIAPERGAIVSDGLQLSGPNAARDELVAVFNESDTNFTLYFQVRIVLLHLD